MDEGGLPPSVDELGGEGNELEERPGPSLLSNHVEPNKWERVSQKSRPLVFGIVITIATIVVAIGTVVYVLIRSLGNRQRPKSG